MNDKVINKMEINMPRLNWSEFRELKLEIEHVNLQAEIEIFFARDTNYGADADGRRGIDARFIEDFKINGVWDLETGNDVTEAYSRNPVFLNAVERKIG